MKHTLKVIGFGICLGILLVVMQTALGIDKDVFIHWYWILAALFVGGCIFFNVVYNISYQKKLKALIPLLDSGREAEFATGVEALLQTAKGKGLQTLLKINLSAGYIETKQYDRSEQLLEGLGPLKGDFLNLGYSLNLGLSYFYTKQYAKAEEVYTANQALFDRYRDHKDYGGNIVVTDILLSVMRGQYEQAKQQVSEAKEVWTLPRFQKVFAEIENILSENAP